MLSLSSVFGFVSSSKPTTDRIQEPENQLINSSTPASPIANSSFEHGLMAAGFVSPTTTVNSNAEYDNQPVKQSLYTSLLNMFTTRNTNINSNNDNNSVAHTGSETSSNNGIIDEKNDPPDFEDDNLSLDCYEMNEEENVDDDVAANILALSVSDCETLVGWQIELYRSSKKNHSLGTFVILEAKKRTFQPVKYLLITKDMQNHGLEVLRWAVLKRTANEPGKPFRLLRKVRDFDEDSDDSDLDSALEHDTQSIMSTNRHEGQDGRNEEYDFEEDSLDDYP